MTELKHTYVPGGWLAVASDRGAALLPPDVSDEVAEAVLEHLRTGIGLAPFVDALTAAFGASMSAIPDFALAITEGDGMRIAVRGRAVLEIRDSQGTREVTGAGVSTWAESVLSAGASVSLRFGPATAGRTIPLGSGVVLADAVNIGVGAAPVASQPPQQVDSPLAPVADVAVAELQPSGDTTLYETGDEDEVLDSTFGDLWGATELSSSPVEATSPPPAVPTPAQPPFPPENVAPPASPPPEPASVEPVAPPAPAVEPVMVEPETPQIDGMIAGVPKQWSTTPGTDLPAAPPPAPASQPTASSIPLAIPQAPPPDLGDHDGETISVAALGDRAQAPVPANVTATAPSMRAKVTVSTGSSLDLDRPVIIGRRPKAVRISGDMPHLVTVPSPLQDISRSHLEIRIEGTAIVAFDLNTTNGSFLKRAGAEPVRLHPGEPTVVVDRDVIDIGDGVTVTVEEQP